jgi:hypothetical protein
VTTQQNKRGDSEGYRIPLSPRVSVFAVCLVLAGAFWLLHTLSKEYTIRVHVPVVYNNLPGSSLLPQDLPDSVDADIKASGFTLMILNMSGNTSAVEMDLSRARSVGNGEYALTTNERQHFLQSAIGKDIRVMKIYPDTIFVGFEGKMEKRVRVIPRVTVNCAPGYRLGDSVKITPEFVMLRGPEPLLAKINSVETETRIFDDVSSSIETELKVVLPEGNAQLSVQPAMVRMNVLVGQYTEGRFTIPLNVINVPSSVDLKTFPDKVDVVFQVPVEDYASIKPEMFRAVADYRKVQSGTQSLPVEIVRQPAIIRNLKTEPARVDYIIRK